MPANLPGRPRQLTQPAFSRCLSCAPAVADYDHAAEDHGGGKDFLPGEGVHSDGDAYDDCYDRLDVAIHADQSWTDPFLRHRDQEVCDEGGAYDQICKFCVLC